MLLMCSKQKMHDYYAVELTSKCAGGLQCPISDTDNVSSL